MLKDKQELLKEFFRYAVVGGVSFLADAGMLALLKQLLFRENCTQWQMALCVASGFVVGLVVNYLLSTCFVFRTEKQKERSKQKTAFLVYSAVGVVGLGLTELGMWLGGLLVGNDGLWYILVKCFVAGVVLIWNYLGRKIFVYRGE